MSANLSTNGKQTALSFLFYLILVSGLPAQSAGFSWPEGKKAALSLSFDDARLSNVDVGKDLFRRLDTRVTFYVVPSGVKQRLEGWKAIVADGHEIGNHTVYHPCTGNFLWSRDKALEDYTLYSMQQELLSANQQIRELLDVTPVSFAYTCGNTFVGRGLDTRSYVPLVAELFESGRGWLNEAANDPGFADLALLQGIEMDGKDFATEIKALVDAAVGNGSWLLLAGHEIGEGGRQTTRVKMLEQLIAYARRPESGIWLAPVGEVAAYVRHQRSRQASALKAALSFCATFDRGMSADLAKGDPRSYGAPDYEQAEAAIPDWLPEEVTLAPGRGRFGQALEFKRKAKPVLFYPAKGNIAYREQDWSGAISLWLSLDPEADLAPGYTDPIQITDSGYDDAAIWVDFSDKDPRSFRMGLFGDTQIWNPDKLGPDINPAFNARLLPAADRPFARGRWTHVVVSFSGLNTDQGQASLYINGNLQGSRSITEPFTWELEKSKIFVGLNFVGLMDELSIFDRALSAEEVRAFYNLPGGMQDVLKNQ